MTTTNILGVISGLSLFLYGIHMLSEGLKLCAGNKLERILKYVTGNKIKAVLSGALVTAFIHSSSALSVMLIGFVNAGLLPLKNAIWTLMGADIGTTITGQMIALNMGMIAPIFSIMGVIMILFIPSSLFKKIGGILSGLGILFIGMDIMSTSLSPLQDNPYFLNLIQTLSNPIMAVIVGALFTALIQSSSASIGILQVLALNYLIEFNVAAFVVFGQNIGTCITSTLASLSGDRNAKRLALFHMLFNVVGAILFTVICIYTPLIKYIDIYSYNPASAIANLHTLYNTVMVILVLPIDRYLIAFIYKVIPEK